MIAAAFYKFVSLPDFASLKAPLLEFCEQRAVKGTILLAAEGINGTIAGETEKVREVLAYLRGDPRLADLEHKESGASRRPFYRMKVRLKREIVTLGVPGVDPTRMAGTYVKPQDWNRLLDEPGVVVIDVLFIFAQLPRALSRKPQRDASAAQAEELIQGLQAEVERR
jgi:UPF0176 protein